MKDVSIIIPVYNAEKYITNAIESALSQKNVNIEVLVINDGSTDGSEKKILQFRDKISYFRQSNKGPAAARNLGIKAAKTEFLAFLDADDVFFSVDTINSCVFALSEEQHADILLGRVQLQKEDGAIKNSFSNIAEAGFITGFGAMVSTRSVFDTVGLIEESLKLGEDIDWFMRAWENGIVTRLVNDIVILYRRHDGNLTKSLSSLHSSFLKSIGSSLIRRKNKNRSISSEIFVGLDKIRR
jgi:glycosyltransferase involved in cell wall biosynthesis